MNIEIKNNTRFELSPNIKCDFNKPYDLINILEKTLIEPINTPVSQNRGVEIKLKNDDGTEEIIDETFIIKSILRTTTDEHINPEKEKILKELYAKVLINFPKTTKLPSDMVFPIQTMDKMNYPEPTEKIIYTPKTDIIPAAKKAQSDKNIDELTMAITFCFKPKTLGISFINEDIFNEYKDFIKKYVSTNIKNMPQQNISMLNSFYKLKLDKLTESIRVRKNKNDILSNMKENSITRIIIDSAIEFAKINENVKLMPFSFEQMLFPESIVFVNVEKHANGKVNEIKKEWDTINESLKMPIRTLSLTKVTKLKSNIKIIEKVTSKKADFGDDVTKIGMRKKIKPFATRQPSKYDIAKKLKILMKHMANVNKSMNTFKTVKHTYQKPNRRNPDDFNKKGIATSTTYYPDIHIYLDTSGSISEDMYKDAVIGIIKMCKTLNVNMYFSSFTSVHVCLIALILILIISIRNLQT